MRVRGCSWVAILSLSVPGTTWAFTQAEIDQAALVARQIDIVSVIADDIYQGRNNNTPASTAVQGVLIDALKLISSGLNTSQTGDDAYRQFFSTTATGTNLLGVIPGTDLADEYVMVGAHYDHFPPLGSDIFNGATDNAAGAAVVLAIGAAIQSLPTAPRRSVILALWDAEEDGLVGSLAYANSPLVPLASTIAYINFDVLGANLLPSLRDVSFAIGAESGGSALQGFVQSAIAQQSLDTRVLSRAGGQDRSDHANFINQIPSVFFSDGTGSCYHTRDDDITAVDLEKLREQSQIGFRLTVALSETSTPPAWVQTSFPPFFPIGVPVYEDAVVINEVLDGALADIALFSPAEQATLLGHQAAVLAIVNAGPGSFNCLVDCQVLADAVLFALDALNALRCDGFGALTLSKQASPAPVPQGERLSYTLTAQNQGSFEAPSAVISDLVPPNTTYVAGSASDGGTESGGLVTWPAITLGPAQSVQRSFSVDLGPGLISSALGFSDDLESGASNWTASHGAGSVDWLLVGTHPDSGASSWFAENVAGVSDQLLALASPYSVPSTGASLSFHHDYDTETGFDGGVVEISTDGVVWSDLGPHAIENPYNGSISTCCFNPIGGRPAFSGSSGGYIRSRFDLSAFAGSQIWIRFRMGTDNIVAATGWWIDDVELGVLVVNDAQVDAGGAARASARRETQVIPEPDPMILLISGILGLAALGRGRTRA